MKRAEGQLHFKIYYQYIRINHP